MPAIHRQIAMTSLLVRTVTFLLLLIFAGVARAAEVREPKIGSPERKAIMEIMRAPVSKGVGKRVTFTGSLKICGDWATFDGDAKPTDGVMPKSSEHDLTLDFFALLRLENRKWKVLLWGFAGDIGLLDGARRKYPQVPKELVHPIPAE